MQEESRKRKGVNSSNYFNNIGPGKCSLGGSIVHVSALSSSSEQANVSLWNVNDISRGVALKDESQGNRAGGF